ncbi:MAG: glycosyltransferase family 2 protein [Bacilli bacterium]|nr:glycosyltransferase family 2 protein [Bacilli bacterium]
MGFINYLLDIIIRFLGSLYPAARNINNFIGTLLPALVVYQVAYFIIGLFFTRKFNEAKNYHKYGIVISARNEEMVIGNLIDSIKKQDYPSELITIFVVADNCTDKTAEIARSKGCICYERFDTEHKTKGYALEYLFDRIEEDYGRSNFEGFFVFDADNLLKKDYISKMNNAFDSGERIITSYRNIKNIDENWITMSFAVHWLRSIRQYHRARSFLRLATNIQGTGYLFSSEVVKDGWHYVSLTEDRGLTADAVSQGYRISYQDEAEFYDEQTPNPKVAYNQKLRWSKGLLINFKESGWKLFRNIFLGRRFATVKWSKQEREEKFWKRVGIGIKDRFIMFDTFMHLLPTNVINLFRWILVVLILRSCYCYSMGIDNVDLFSGGTYLAMILRHFFDIKIHITSGDSALWQVFLLGVWTRLFYRIGSYIEHIIVPWYILFLERKRIKKMPISKILVYSLIWPIFDIVGRYTTYIALFKKVGWKPVPHTSKITIDDLSK